MTAHDMRVYKKQLEELANRLNAQVRNLRDETLRTSGNSDSDSGPAEQADLGSHETEEERTLPILQSEEEILRDVKFAQARMNRGTFGKCEKCGSVIAKKRLDAVPYARHCMACAGKLANEVAASK